MMADPSTALRDPGLLRIGELVEPSINGPFDSAQGAWAGEGSLDERREPGTGLEGFYDFGGFVKIWEGQFFCEAVVHFGCGFGFHGDAGQDRDVEFL